ncbi:hypothetical protein OF83DRAFT_1138993 [Amylostereum chailletii]|nr:hypothetical protein OF83DRAFT_1138993 [Amylostereum chailletii]
MASIPTPSPSPPRFIPVVSHSPSDATVTEQRMTLAGSELDFPILVPPLAPAVPSHTVHPGTTDASSTTAMSDAIMFDAPSLSPSTALSVSPASGSSPTPTQPAPSAPAKRKAEDSSSAPRKKPKSSPPKPLMYFAPYMEKGSRAREIVEPIMRRLTMLVHGGVALRPEYRVMRPQRAHRHPLRAVWKVGDPASGQEITDRTTDTRSFLRDLARKKKAIFDAKNAAQKGLLNPKATQQTSSGPSAPVAQGAVAPAAAPSAAPSPGGSRTPSPHHSPSRAHLHRARENISAAYPKLKVVTYFDEFRSNAWSRAWPLIVAWYVTARTKPAPRTVYTIVTSMTCVKLESCTTETTPDGETVCIVYEKYLDI